MPTNINPLEHAPRTLISEDLALRVALRDSDAIAEFLGVEPGAQVEISPYCNIDEEGRSTFLLGNIGEGESVQAFMLGINKPGFAATAVYRALGKEPKYRIMGGLTDTGARPTIRERVGDLLMRRVDYDSE